MCRRRLSWAWWMNCEISRRPDEWLVFHNMRMESTKNPVIGAAPQGASDIESASRAVRDMFSSIAPRYDLLNHVLSMNVDRLWWNRTARRFPTFCRGRMLACSISAVEPAI